jgi:hypothetical protein
MRRSAQKVVSLGPQGDFYPPGFFASQKRIITGQAKTENYQFKNLLISLIYMST